MGQGQGIRDFDREDEIVRNAVCVGFDSRKFRKSDACGEEAPEPLVDLNRVEMFGIIGKIIVRFVVF